MKKFTNPLDSVKIASPCSANWNEMRGDERKKYCAMCRLNVYNLSDMTRAEAESFLINSEGRVCVKFYRRTDGTVITKDCPIGWGKIKRNISRMATAVFALVAGFFAGNFVFNQRSFDNSDLMKKVTPISDILPEKEMLVTEGEVSNLDEIKFRTKKTKSASKDKTKSRTKTTKPEVQMLLGRIENSSELEFEPAKRRIE